MLGSLQIIRELKQGNAGNQEYISVVPIPDFSKIYGASIDLHLGRWFCLPKQSRDTHYSFKEEQSNPSNFSSKEYFCRIWGQIYSTSWQVCSRHNVRVDQASQEQGSLCNWEVEYWSKGARY